MKKITVIGAIFACAVILFFSTCKKESSTGTSSMAVRLKDAPAHCDKAKLEIKGIKVYSEKDGWITIPINDTIIDILQLQDTSALLGIINIDAGTITQVQVILGGQDSVTIDGYTYVLALMGDSLTIKVNDTIAPNSSFTLTIDINAAQSIFDDGDHHHFHLDGSASCAFRKDHDGNEHGH